MLLNPALMLRVAISCNMSTPVNHQHALARLMALLGVGCAE
jgi:hypothetical protein